MNINNFQGDTTDITARKEALQETGGADPTCHANIHVPAHKSCDGGTGLPETLKK